MSDDSTLLSGQASTDTGTQPAAEPIAAPDTQAAAPDGGEAQGQQPAGEPKADDAPQGAPETYEFNLPEGYELNAEIGGEFTTFAKDLNLPQDKAQAVVDMGIKLVDAAMSRMEEARQAQIKSWRDEVVNDKEIGGPNLAENLGYAAKVLDTFAPNLRQVLDQTGLGNHPDLVRAFVAIGKSISEDRLAGGAQSQPAKPHDPAKVLYPNMN